MTDPLDYAIPLPANFIGAFIAQANAARLDEEPLDLKLYADGLRLDLSNGDPANSSYLVLSREGPTVWALICWDSDDGGAFAGVDLSNPQEAASAALRAWHSTR